MAIEGSHGTDHNLFKTNQGSGWMEIVNASERNETIGIYFNASTAFNIVLSPFESRHINFGSGLIISPDASIVAYVTSYQYLFNDLRITYVAKLMPAIGNTLVSSFNTFFDKNCFLSIEKHASSTDTTALIDVFDSNGIPIIKSYPFDFGNGRFGHSRLKLCELLPANRYGKVVLQLPASAMVTAEVERTRFHYDWWHIDSMPFRSISLDQ
jgi:hypothetical protein